MWGVYYRLFLDFNSWIFDKTFRSKVMAWKCQHVNEYLLTEMSYGTDAATFRQNFRRQGLLWFFQRLMVDYKLPGIVRQWATRLSTIPVFCFAVFCILSLTFSLTRALSQNLAGLAHMSHHLPHNSYVKKRKRCVNMNVWRERRSSRKARECQRDANVNGFTVSWATCKEVQKRHICRINVGHISISGCTIAVESLHRLKYFMHICPFLINI